MVERTKELNTLKDPAYNREMYKEDRKMIDRG